MPRARTVLLTSIVWFAFHAVVWAFVANFEPSRHPYDVSSMFDYWDSLHYSLIILRGYGDVQWAFYPLYPLLVKGFAAVTALPDRPEIAGAILSTLLFIAFCLWQARLAGRAVAGGGESRGLVPATAWGWLFFLFSPASYIFHSHHTESLFLLLSFAAFFFSREGRWKWAALLAGLCALTKNQGVFVALAVALDGALRGEGPRDQIKIFCASGAISLLLFACYPAYQFFAAGDALLFVRVQNEWSVVHSVAEYARTLWLGNPWQWTGWTSVLHLVFFYLLNAGAVGLLFRREFPLALYVLLSLWLPVMQGHVENSFRYGAILFPALFLLGDGFARLPRPLRWALAGAVIYLNLIYARKYALGEWAY